MAEPTGGRVCAARNCKNKSYTCMKSFFTFPKDPARARIWAIASNREDLLYKSDGLYGSYRLCGDHFEAKMFTNHICNRLNPNAVPTIFPQMEALSIAMDHNYSLPRLVHVPEVNVEKLGCEIEDATENLTTQQQELLKEIQAVETKDDASVNCKDISLPELLSPVSSTQTPNSFSFNLPKKRTYRETVKSLKDQNKKLKLYIKELESRLCNIEENTAMEQ